MKGNKTIGHPSDAIGNRNGTSDSPRPGPVAVLRGKRMTTGSQQKATSHRPVNKRFSLPLGKFHHCLLCLYIFFNNSQWECSLCV